MIKFKQGWIMNPNTGVKKDIVVKSKTPNTLLDILIGGGIVLLGMTYLTITAFKNGSKKFEEAENATFEALQLLTDDPRLLNLECNHE